MSTAPVSRVADLTARRLDALLARDQAAGRLPSVVAGVVRDGALVWTGARGTATGSDAGPTPRTCSTGSARSPRRSSRCW